MGYHYVNLLRPNIELDSISTLFVAAGVSFLLFVCLLHGVLLRLFLEYFALFRRVPRAMHQAYLCTGWSISWMDCMICLALAGTSLLVVGWQGGFSSLAFPDITSTVGFFPVVIFSSVTTFVNTYLTVSYIM